MITVEFPISEKSFMTWLATESNKKAGIRHRLDPITAAVRDLAPPEIDGFFGDEDWCFSSDLAYGGNQHRPYPKWTLRVIAKIDEMGSWEIRRGKLLEALGAK